jgi:hypothetical protein
MELPSLEKLAVNEVLPPSLEISVERKVWVEGRVVYIRLALELPKYVSLANMLFNTLRPAMSIASANLPIRLETQHRDMDSGHTHVIFQYSWQGNQAASVWEIGDKMGDAMDVRNLFTLAFANHNKYKRVTIHGITPDLENLEETETRHYHVNLSE